MIEKEELLTIIPHRGKMLLLSRVIEYDIEHSIRAEYDITKDCLFYDPVSGGVPSWAGFEFIAQTISALTGIRKRERREKPNIGIILSISSMRMEIPLFKDGCSVEIRAEETDCTDSTYTFEGAVFLENKKVIEGKLMVMVINDERFKSLTGERTKNE
jgi:predicted hotdog family 3-hydroxylacyl-ACP dehydratase